MKVRYVWWPISIQYGWTPGIWWWGSMEGDIAIIEPLKLTVRGKAFWLGPLYIRFGHSHSLVLDAHEMQAVLKQATDNYHATVQGLSESFGTQAGQLAGMHNDLVQRMATAADQVNTMAHNVAANHKLNITDPCLEIVGTLTPPHDRFNLKHASEFTGLLH